jgi:hypothetical protein
MFAHRLDFSLRFQKSTPKMANLAFVRNANFLLPKIVNVSVVDQHRMHRTLILGKM